MLGLSGTLAQALRPDPSEPIGDASGIALSGAAVRVVEADAGDGITARWWPPSLHFPGFALSAGRMTASV